MSEEQILRSAIKALGEAMELNRQTAEANRQMVQAANSISKQFGDAAASMERSAEKLEALLRDQEEPAAARTKFSPTHEVSNDGDETLEMPVGDGADTYDAYNYAATGMNRSKTQYDRLYRACLASRKEAEFHAMMLQLAQNMSALKRYEASDDVYYAEEAILDALYDDDEAEDAMEEGLEYQGGIDADWDSLLENLQKALGICVPEDEDAGEVWTD